ncbi:hypothetical protein TNCV_2328881 [Trichonephila clavipes]|nr:hypothetical protein TNCV_2328881 [Trichonephila clavipes]
MSHREALRILQWNAIGLSRLKKQGLCRRLALMSEEVIKQWIPGHCGVTGDAFMDHLAKKGASIQHATSKDVPFISAERIIK